jgi:hypothetical protein
VILPPIVFPGSSFWEMAIHGEIIELQGTKITFFFFISINVPIFVLPTKDVIASLVPTKTPFGALVFVENVNLIVAGVIGVIVIITSLGPYTLFLHRINNHLHHYWMKWNAQTNHELDYIREPSLGTPCPEPPYCIIVREGTEILPNRQIEFLIVRAGDVA